MEKAEQDKLLQIARENYPVGTVFKSALSPSQYMYKVEVPFWEIDQGGDIVVNRHSGASIYHEGKWGEIVSKPEPVVNNLYPIY